MVKVGLLVPVYKNFVGFAELMKSVDHPVEPIIIPNWEENIGVSAGWNVGMVKATIKKCTHLLVCNDDVILDEGTISKLIYSLLSEADLVTAANRRDVELTEFPEYDHDPDFSCFMIKPQQFIDKFGYFDEHFSPAYFEDCDMHYRIKVAGGQAFRRLDAGMFHKGSVTQNWGGQKVVDDRMFLKNRAYYIKKWGGMPGSEKYLERFNGDRS